MTFELKSGLIWITFLLKYEGKELKINNCILDTGSATTAIDIDLVDFNYQKPSTIKRLFGIGGGTQEVISQKVDKVVIDQKIINNVEIEFGDLKEELGINGFIGNDILSHFNIMINYLNQEVCLKWY